MPTRIIDAFHQTAATRSQHPALYSKRNGRWEFLTWQEYRQHVRLAARALISLGVKPGQHVTIIGFNCAEWFIADVGAIAAGAIPAGIYTTSSAEQCRYIADHCEARVAFVENAEHLAKFQAIRAELPHLHSVVLMHGEPQSDDVLSWTQFLSRGEGVADSELDARLAAAHVDDVCTLIYTSGTTGVPKAVMLSHTNITWLLEQANTLVEIRPGDVIVSYLPLSHVAEQLFSLHSNVMLGTTIWFAESMDKLADALRAARPHHFLAVPRVWEKIQAKMEALGSKNPPLKKKLVAWARRTGLEGGYADQDGRARPFTF
jgi:long-subunit acyl-CoA synthetase (AMP-forming)